MTCYSPSRFCLSSGLVALGLAAFTSWVGLQHPTAWIATVLFGIPAVILLILAFQPPIEVYEHHLVLGRRIIPWSEIRRLDRTSWMTPLIVNLTLTGERRVILVYPGDIDAGRVCSAISAGAPRMP